GPEFAADRDARPRATTGASHSPDPPGRSLPDVIMSASALDRLPCAEGAAPYHSSCASLKCVRMGRSQAVFDLTDQLNAALSGRYRIKDELGRGGMASVYLADDLRHRRLVAIKVLHGDLASALGPERFLREIEIVAGLRHPRILPLYDSG